MLIRWATENDLPAWSGIATELSVVMRHPADMGKDPEFISYAKSKASKYEALTAVDYISNQNMGFIGFSRTFNRITWIGVSEKFRGKGAGSRLLKTALRQLDHTNYCLIKLDNRAAIPYALNELEYAYNGVTTREVLERIGVR